AGRGRRAGRRAGRRVRPAARRPGAAGQRPAVDRAAGPDRAASAVAAARRRGRPGAAGRRGRGRRGAGRPRDPGRYRAMIQLILGALRARWARAVPLLLLSMVAVGSAVIGPAYLRGVDRAVTDREVSGASAAERSLTISAPTSPNSSGLDISRI